MNKICFLRNIYLSVNNDKFILFIFGSKLPVETPEKKIILN